MTSRRRIVVELFLLVLIPHIISKKPREICRENHKEISTMAIRECGPDEANIEHLMAACCTDEEINDLNKARVQKQVQEEADESGENTGISGDRPRISWGQTLPFRPWNLRGQTPLPARVEGQKSPLRQKK